MNRYILTATVAALVAPAFAQEKKWDLRDGDRVLLLGDALLERENTLGHLEARMHAAWPQTKFTVRNLSWAGDTPRGWSRAAFDGPDKGYERLKEHIALVKPTVVILGYGMAASLQEMTDHSGDILLNRDPARYGAQPMSATRFKKELGELMDAIGKDARFVLLSPIRHEDLRATRPGLPDPAKHNELLALYSKSIEELAKERGGVFVDLFAHAKPGTTNGIHLKEDDTLSKMVVHSLAAASEQKVSASVREAVLRKNDLFFHRTRPANSTYLFGFRKHEQGNNAVEIPKFDPLVDAVDAEIDTLKRQPQKGASAPPSGSPETPSTTSKPQSSLPLPTFTTQDGYEITLWADTNLVGKPVGMNWDPAGRLWVACSPVYPQIAPGAHPDDKVVILEDTDRDGKADKSTLFSDNLLIAAGVAPDLAMRDAQNAPAEKNTNPRAVTEKAPDAGNATPGEQLTPHPASRIPHLASAYVGSSTELLHLTDTDGDGTADQRRVVLSGFGTEDTHHTIHTLRWGPDGRLYFNQSIYIHSHIETPYGMVRVNSGAILAYDPRTERTEVHAKGWCNPWGHVWDEWGQEFVTDGAGYQGISWLVPGAMYFTYENARRIMPSVSPGTYPKFCGLELVRSPLFPVEWQGHAITCDFRAHRIARFSIKDLSPAKSGYETKAEPDLVRTTDSSFRPIDVKLGPDGALYIADWTNPVINHGEVDFRDARRDKVNGRIWRIAPKGKALKWESLVGKKESELAESMDSKNHWESHSASAALNEQMRQKDVERRKKLSDPNLVKITKKLSSIVIPEINLRESTAREAIELLVKKSKELDPEKEGVNIVLKDEDGSARPPAAPVADPVPAPAPVVGGTRITLSLKDVPLINTLKYVTNLGNLKYWIEPSGVTIAPIAATLGPDLHTKKWYVRPEFLTRIPNTQSSAKDTLMQAGVEFPPGAMAIYSKRTGALTVRNSDENLDLIEKILESVSSGGTQIQTRTEVYQGMIRNPAPRVRLEAMRALARIPTLESAALVLEAALNAPGGAEADPHYAYAAWLSVNDLAPQVVEWVRARAESGDRKAESKQPNGDNGGAATSPVSAPRVPLSEMLTYALTNLPADQSRPLIADIIAKNGAPKDGPWIELIGQTGGPAEAEKLIPQLAEPRAAAALVAAARRGVKPPGATLDVLKAAPAAAQPDAVRLAGLWKLKDAAPFLASQVAGNADAAFEAFTALGGAESASALEKIIAETKDAAHRRGALRVLAFVAPASALARTETALAATPENVLVAEFRALFTSKAFADALAKEPKLSAPLATAALRAARELGKKGEKLTAALTPLAGTTPAPVAQDFTHLVEMTKKNGNPVEGEVLYRRAALACTVCHAIGGAGGKVGPDLMTIGASAPLDYLVESLVAPNAKVKEGYHAIALTLKGGRAASGVMLRETPEAVFLRDAAGNESSVQKADITARENIGSIMPAGLLNSLTEREQTHVFAFMAQLGKPGPFDATKADTARVWWLHSGKDAEAVVAGKAKQPGVKVLTFVDGRLTKETLTESLQMLPDTGDTLIAVAKFNGAGKTRLKLTGITKAWLDGAPLAIASDPSPEVTLPAGDHTLAVKLDVKQLPAAIRAACDGTRFAVE